MIEVKKENVDRRSRTKTDKFLDGILAVEYGFGCIHGCVEQALCLIDRMRRWGWLTDIPIVGEWFMRRVYDDYDRICSMYDDGVYALLKSKRFRETEIPGMKELTHLEIRRNDD